jgi:hypothetical protein
MMIDAITTLRRHRMTASRVSSKRRRRKETVSIPIDDDQLAALALAADPDQPIDPNAQPFVMRDVSGPLPSWYMPAPAMRAQEPWQVAVVLFVVGTLLLISGLGLCITYGYLVTA